MHIISALIYAFSANIDCLPIAVTYGINRIHIPVKANLFISLFSAIGTYCSMKVGNLIVKWLSVQKANTLGCFLLLILGLYFLYSFFTNDHRDTDTKPPYQTITFLHVLFLATTLTINNVALGIGASITGIPCLVTSVLSFGFSFLCIAIGQRIGHSYFANTFKKYPNLLSSVLLIILAIYEFFI